jgi:hypothetical protein
MGLPAPWNVGLWCSNALCANLAGPCELQLRTLACGGGCGARYCSSSCQRQAWQGGHCRVGEREAGVLWRQSFGPGRVLSAGGTGRSPSVGGATAEDAAHALERLPGSGSARARQQPAPDKAPGP